MKKNYEDIINLPHPSSKKHPRMSLIERAAQFSPFAALTGYGDAVEETGRLTDLQREASEDVKAELDETLQWLMAHSAEQPELTVTYFQPDERKQGGAYVTHKGRFWKADPVERTLRFLDGRKIGISGILKIDRIDIASGNG